MRRKKVKREHNPIKMPKPPVKSINTRRKKKNFDLRNIFRRKKNNPYSKRRNISKNTKYILLPIIFLFVFGILYLSIRYVLLLRENAYGEKEYEIGQVVGLEDVPTVGGSYFLFEQNMDDSVVKEYLSGGNSVYKLPKDISTKYVEEYYLEKLKKLGWEHIQTVSIGTPDKKYGQYWVKDGKGLRIYSKYNDVWYESITEEDARSALSRLVQDEIEREMLMASTDKQSLLPDYPWKIEIPKEYLIKYSPSQMGELRGVSFQKIGSSEIVEIYPVGKWKERDLDAFLFEYCNLKSTQEVKYGILNSVPISYRDTLGLKSTIQINSDNVTAYTIANTFNSIVYVISSSQVDSPLLGYVIENIKPMGVKD